MNRNSKKGFTIVELIIVIAVIAVLAAVLIPTFSNLIQKANEAKDTALVSNLNKAVAMDNGSKETVYDVLKVAEDIAGINVAKINAAANSNEILWDSTNKCFVYSVNGEIKYIPDTKTKDVAGDYDYWKLSSNQEDIAKGQYSIYWTGANLAEVEAATGFDAGDAEIAEVKYDRQNESVGRKVTIRTNGGKLTVNAPQDTVAHYGKASGVQITAVYDKSYHEHGEVVGDIVITKGRIELAATAQVGTVLVASESIGAVKVDVVSGAQVGTVAPTTDAAQEDVKASNTIPTESKVETKVEANSDFAGGLGTERSPYLIANGTQFANINKLSSEILGGKTFYFKQVADISIDGSVVNFAGEYDGNNFKLTYDSKSQRGCDYIFVRMKGHSEFRNINVVMGKVAVSLLKEADWGTSYGATFENLTFASTSAYAYANTPNFGFVVVEALYTGGNGTPVYNFANITNNVNLQNDGTCTGFIVGSGPCFYVKTTMNYTDCVNNGEINGNNVGFLYGNSAYIETMAESESVINVKNCKNNSILMSNVESGKHSSFAPALDDLNDKFEASVGGSFVTNSYFAGKTIVINQEGTNFTINTGDNSVEYKLAFNVGAIYSTKNGNAWTDDDVATIGADDSTFNVSNGNKYFVELSIDTQKTGALSKTFKAYDKRTAEKNGFTNLTFESEYVIVVDGDTTYLIFDTEADCYINSSISLNVYAYANGVVQGIKTIKN